MYRSRGELRSYALRVFAIYSTNGTLSVPLFQLAWYVLWGKRPDANVMQLLEDTGVNGCHYVNVTGESIIGGDVSCVGEGVGGGGHVACAEIAHLPPFVQYRRRIQEEEFLRLAVLYYDTMGIEAPWFATTEGVANNLEELCNGTPRGVIRAARWAHFEALAGPKGYVILEDIMSTESVDWLRRPFCKAGREGSGAKEKFEISPWHIGDNLTSTGGDNNGRMALLSHAFAIADSDRDGRVVFRDMERHLSG